MCKRNATYYELARSTRRVLAMLPPPPPPGGDGAGQRERNLSRPLTNTHEAPPLLEPPSERERSRPERKEKALGTTDRE